MLLDLQVGLKRSFGVTAWCLRILLILVRIRWFGWLLLLLSLGLGLLRRRFGQCRGHLLNRQFVLLVIAIVWLLFFWWSRRLTDNHLQWCPCSTRIGRLGGRVKGRIERRRGIIPVDLIRVVDRVMAEEVGRLFRRVKGIGLFRSIVVIVVIGRKSSIVLWRH